MTDDISPPTVVSFLRIGKCRLEIFNKACIKFGLSIVDYTKNSFILIDDELDFISANKIVKSSSSIFIRTQWLSDSIKQNKLLSHQSYILHGTSSHSISSIKDTSNPSNKNEILTEPPPPLKRERSISSSASDTDDEPSSKKVFN